jgi:hypothetical protein
MKPAAAGYLATRHSEKLAHAVPHGLDERQETKE